MKRKNILIRIILIILIFKISILHAAESRESRTIHVFVALCDNENQGIVPVPPKLGNGEDPENNLYWGARYGIKAFFQRSAKWRLLKIIKKPSDEIIARCIFKHSKQNVYMVADAYKGKKIKEAIIDFLESSSGKSKEKLSIRKKSEDIDIEVKGSSQLIVYVGHNGLMDFSLKKYPAKKDNKQRDAIILACASKEYFCEPLKKTGAKPLLWTTGLMAPEAYTLENAIEGWILKESDEAIRLRAAKAYNKYQRCGINSAKRLFKTGY
ncbi:MAG: hypothetical protein GTO45_04845 [Candidatus Aminicenantes bacterium]|nr:hypothetical protein [Candidatus Aminicenantes bacterium]NIM78078.1 hypothetical protein [Candidatus Aminicenantes bacterium]NIN17398.1 hypothetical protein [Candidatus Aminicenantes bacterium]NIN41291.1 hypothetical protein [Candidatus Aminicenantes bacterium]NIN84064.1 hypothetical protein [Candidatus Aminicenantes bacterium]